MKAGTQNHLKVKRLKRLLGIPLYRAVGILETLWLLCSDCADEGDVGKFSDEEIAEYLEWDGPDPSALVRALVDTGWIDRDTTNRLVIHDWLEHCPEFVRERIRKRRMRAAKHTNDHQITTYVSPTADKHGQQRTTPDQPPLVPSFPNPTQPNPTHSSCGEDATARDCDGKTAKATGSEDGSSDGECATDKATSKANGKGYPAQFEEFWNCYPARGGRRRGKRECWSLWVQAIREAERQPLIEATRQYAASDEVARGFARDPKRFLAKDWWRDWLPAVSALPRQPPKPPPEVPHHIPKARFT